MQYKGTPAAAMCLTMQPCPQHRIKDRDYIIMPVMQLCSTCHGAEGNTACSASAKIILSSSALTTTLGNATWNPSNNDQQETKPGLTLHPFLPPGCLHVVASHDGALRVQGIFRGDEIPVPTVDWVLLGSGESTKG